MEDQPRGREKEDDRAYLDEGIVRKRSLVLQEIAERGEEKQQFLSALEELQVSKTARIQERERRNSLLKEIQDHNPEAQQSGTAVIQQIKKKKKLLKELKLVKEKRKAGKKGNTIPTSSDVRFGEEEAQQSDKKRAKGKGKNKEKTVEPDPEASGWVSSLRKHASDPSLDETLQAGRKEERQNSNQDSRASARAQFSPHRTQTTAAPQADEQPSLPRSESASMIPPHPAPLHLV